jgi:hypothetical protein
MAKNKDNPNMDEQQEQPDAAEAEAEQPQETEVAAEEVAAEPETETPAPDVPVEPTLEPVEAPAPALLVWQALIPQDVPQTPEAQAAEHEWQLEHNPSYDNQFAPKD